MSDRRRLRVGLIGMGAVGKLHHLAYGTALNVEVVAVCDTSAERLAAVPLRPGEAQYFFAEDMLQKERLDIACILTPPSSHEALTRLCAQHKVHVFCEKPLALSLESARAMIDAATEAGVELFYGSSYRFLPPVQAARRIIASGGLGDIRLIREQAIGSRGLDQMQVMHESHYPAGGPGGFAMGLADHGIHLIDVFGWLMGSTIRSSHGRANVSGRHALPEFLHLEFDNGAIGQLVYDEGTFPTELPTEGMFSAGDAWDADGFVGANTWTKHPSSINVYGSKASLRIFHYANQLVRIDAEGLRQIPLKGAPSPHHFATQIDQFADDISNGRPASTPAKAGIEALRILLTASAA